MDPTRIVHNGRRRSVRQEDLRAGILSCFAGRGQGKRRKNHALADSGSRWRSGRAGGPRPPRTVPPRSLTSLANRPLTIACLPSPPPDCARLAVVLTAPSAPTPPPNGQTAPLLVRNTTFNILASVVNLAVAFLLAPVLLGALGVERFGLLSLLWAITGSLSFLDLRVGSAITPLAAAALARGQRARVVRLATTATIFYLLLGVLEVGIISVSLCVPGVTNWIPVAFDREGRWALVGAAVYFAISLETLVFTGLLHAFQRYDLAARIVILVAASRAALLTAVAWSGGGLGALLLGEVVVAVVEISVTVRVAQHLLPELRPLGPFDRSAFRELIAFGGKLQIAAVAHVVSLHADKLLLSAFLGLAPVAYYELGQKLAYAMRGLPLLLISAATPVVSTLEAIGDRDRLWDFYLRCTRVLVFAATPLVIFTVIGAAPILALWAGVTAPEARQTVWLLALGSYPYVISIVANSVSVGMRRPELEMRRSALAGALNLVLSGSLIPLVGFIGAPLGTGVSLAVGSWYLIRALNAQFRRTLVPLLTALRRPLLAALPATAVAFLIVSIGPQGKMGAALGLIASALLLGALFFLVALRDGVVTRESLRALVAEIRTAAP